MNEIKYLTHPTIRRPKPCLLMFASLVTLDGFHLLLSTPLTAGLIPEWSGGSMFHPLSHIYPKTLFCCVETVANNVDALFLIDCEQTWHSLWTQLSHWQMFMQNGEYIAFWYFQLLCYLTQLQFTIGQNDFVEFLCFLGQQPNLSDLSVQHHLFVRSRLKLAYHLLTIVSE